MYSLSSEKVLDTQSQSLDNSITSKQWISC